MEIELQGERVLLQDIKEGEEERKTKSGIMLASEPSNDIFQRAKIKSVGIDIGNKFYEGQEVLYFKRRGTPLKLEDEEYILIEVSDIILRRLN